MELVNKRETEKTEKLHFLDDEVRQIPMQKSNILIYEKIEGKLGGKVREFLELGDTGRLIEQTGYKIWVIYNSDGEELTHYDSEKDVTDLSCLEGTEGNYLCSVDKNEKDNFIWTTMRVIKYKDNNRVAVGNARECTEEESELLNELFPEYLDNAF